MIGQTILVVTPVYNSEETLEKAIQSILSQRCSNLILTIVDDCSTDNSLKIAKQFLSDPRVSIYRSKKNMGAYYSRNFGLYINRNRKWDYFTTHDADDISNPKRYATLLKYLRGRVNGVQDIFMRRYLESNEAIDEQLTMAHALFTRDVFNAIGYFDDVRFGADWEHWARLKQYNALTEQTTTNCRIVLGDSYIHDKNLTVTIPIGSKKRMDYIKKVLRRTSGVSDTDKLYTDFATYPDLTSKVGK